MKRKPVKEKPKKGKNPWEDHYSRQAKKDNYPARSVYKLQEIQRKFTLIKKNDRVLDLGCAPGSWLVYAAELAGSGGKVIGIDLKPLTISLPSQAQAFEGNILEPDQARESLFAGGFNVVLSDMAPATTGMKDVDAARSFELCSMALDLAVQVLHSKGAFVCKIFQGEDFTAFTDRVRLVFDTYKIFKPESCRKQSKEIYIIGTGKK
ncbi:MAG: RlmE family RNA methyltransferase [Proteobacteria bacterium]|nr:RlmE family RNA methyltransferase [Pseudomonadota bacterium]